ncbi:MAG: hypothetical protein ACYDCS_12890 [Candidatus Dormibacteria bacterium]
MADVVRRLGGAGLAQLRGDRRSTAFDAPSTAVLASIGARLGAPNLRHRTER